MSHTPGPWVWNWKHSELCREGQPPYTYGDMVAQLDESASNGSADISEADANLIAAAPDLLAALKEVMQWIDGHSPNFIYDSEWPQTSNRIEAAIAKAEGAS